MKIRVLSDLHVEINGITNNIISQHPDDKDTTLVVAGDFCPITMKATLSKLLTNISNQFDNVLLVAGNHEFYGSSLNSAITRLGNLINKLNLHNVHVLQQSTYVTQDVLFVGASLWADFQNRNPIVMQIAESAMADYRNIKTGTCTRPYTRYIKADDLLQQHIKDKQFIVDTVTDAVDYKHVVVITHHAPSFLSASPRFKSSNVNGAYMTEMFDIITDLSPTLWIHGHVHNNNDYHIGQTRVISNPFGYYNQNPNFIPTLTVDL